MTNAAGMGFETQGVSIPSDEVVLKGDLTLPAGARGLVLFAHGSGSGRLSPRNRMVARRLPLRESGVLRVRGTGARRLQDRAHRALVGLLQPGVQ